MVGEAHVRGGTVVAFGFRVLMLEQPARKLRLVPTSVEEGRQTDAEMVGALQRKEGGAAEAIWNRHSVSVRRFLGRALGSPDDEVEDLTQEVFIRVFARARAIRQPDALRGFVMSVAFWVLKWELRRRWVRRAVGLSKTGDLPEIGVQGGADQEARHALRSCYAILDRLSVQERTAFVLRYLEEMTIEEVAERLECSLSTAKRVLTRATARVSAHVGKNADLRSYFRDVGDAGDAESKDFP
ncbi:MAG TPA: RNA polymerase sigma factor [Polyangia bacterium]